MSSRVFLSPETELFFVKTHIIHALAETTLEAYAKAFNHIATSIWCKHGILLCHDSYSEHLSELSARPIGPDSWSRNGNPSENCPIVCRPPGTHQMAMDNCKDDDYSAWTIWLTHRSIIAPRWNLYVLNWWTSEWILLRTCGRKK